MTITIGDGRLALMGHPRDAFTVEQDVDTGKWFVVDLRQREPYRYLVPYDSSAMAINFMDRITAHLDGAPLEFVEELRAEADSELRALKS